MNQKLKIGILGLAGKPIPVASGDISAPHIVLNNLIPKLQEFGHQVTVFTGSDSQVEAKIFSAGLSSPWKTIGPENENPITYTERKVELDQVLSREAIEMYRKGELDIINSHDIRFSPYLFLESETPVLYTPHFSLQSRDIEYDEYRYKLMQNPLFGVANLSKENIQFCESKQIKNYGYVPNGVEIEKYSFNDSQREGLLLVGRMVAGKMIKEAIKIAKNLDQKITLIGPKGSKDEDDQYFQELEKDYFSQPQVNFVNFLPAEKIIPYYQKAKVLLFPSKNEGMPLSILEAMATGLPVVASAVGGIKDVIENGKDGFLLESNDINEWQDKVKEALEIDNKLCRNKIESKFTLEISTKHYLEAYQDFISNGK